MTKWSEGETLPNVVMQPPILGPQIRRSVPTFSHATDNVAKLLTLICPGYRTV